MGKGGWDVLVAGAGVFGLAAALACARRGMRVLVVEAAAPGAGASGGPVGALAPHAPAPWTARKAAQAEALAAASHWWGEVAAEAGVDPGHARIGRAFPLADAVARARAEASAALAAAHWPSGCRWEVTEADALPGWLDPAAAPAGIVRETLSARLAPAQAVAALAAALVARGGAIRAGWPVEAVADGAFLSRGERLSAGVAILAAGAGTAALAPGLPLGAAPGRAALLAASAPPGAPILTGDGLWIVPRPGGLVGVGSTSDPEGEPEAAGAARLDAVIARARALCPALAAAPVVARWSGLRPRAARPDPLLGPLPGRDRVLVATGGFRTGLATAPQAGALVAAMAAGERPALPPSWSLEEHLATAAKAR